MEQVPFRSLPFEVLAQASPLLRDAEVVVARRVEISPGLEQYVVVGVGREESVCVRVVRNHLGAVRREVVRAHGHQVVLLLHAEGLLDGPPPRPEPPVVGAGQLSN